LGWSVCCLGCWLGVLGFFMGGGLVWWVECGGGLVCCGSGLWCGGLLWLFWFFCVFVCCGLLFCCGCLFLVVFMGSMMGGMG